MRKEQIANFGCVKQLADISKLVNELPLNLLSYL